MTVRTFRYESATVQLHDWGNGTAAVSSLFSRVRGQGHATEVMKRLLEYSDERDLTLLLTVQRFGHPIGPDNAFLVQFYEKLGFEQVPSKGRLRTLTRTSQKKHAP